MNEETNVNHGRSLLIKAILIFPVLWIVLTVFNGVSFWHSTILGIALLLISYLGDLMILPRVGNMTATIGDLALSFIVLWGGLNLLGYSEAMGEAFLAGAILAVGEYFFHSWLLKTQYGNTYV
ncbi:DUF2512 family protein [Sporosarcina sp. 179-K 8C2 HS]|uniref:DUF2512 family protein n=1 Tax=Sporosarcina sp. 179-K 8C2 HS TaxID=3142387 RepID=UPI0039A263EA